MKFSQRIGIRPPKKILQVESIDNDLKNRLWNVLLEKFFNEINYSSYGIESTFSRIGRQIWCDFFILKIDEIPLASNPENIDRDDFIKYLKNWFFTSEWFDIYEFIEFIVNIDNERFAREFSEIINLILEKEDSGYRFVNSRIVQITSEIEIQEIKDAIENIDIWNSVSIHLNTALEYLAHKNKPNYRNSIKESISAVEALCKIILKDDKITLGAALNKIEMTHKIHKALKNGFSSIYGYTSETGGIRHSLLESDTIIDFEEAKFMLIACSAFINYLKAKMNK